MVDEWTQNQVIHCPIKDCKGMLLEHFQDYKFKCSDCNKKFIFKTEIIEVEK